MAMTITIVVTLTLTMMTLHRLLLLLLDCINMMMMIMTGTERPCAFHSMELTFMIVPLSHDNMTSDGLISPVQNTINLFPYRLITKCLNFLPVGVCTEATGA